VSYCAPEEPGQNKWESIHCVFNKSLVMRCRIYCTRFESVRGPLPEGADSNRKSFISHCRTLPTALTLNASEMES